MHLLDTHLLTLDPWPQTPTPARDIHADATHALLTLEDGLQRATTWPQAVALGLALSNTDDPQALDGHLAPVRLITLHFPKFTDGRAYSQARLLRRRLGYRHALRATGHIIVDMLPLLQRCGVDQAVLAPGQTLQAARRALSFFPAHYQGDQLEPRPAYLRQERAGRVAVDTPVRDDELVT